MHGNMLNRSVLKPRLAEAYKQKYVFRHDVLALLNCVYQKIKKQSVRVKAAASRIESDDRTKPNYSRTERQVDGETVAFRTVQPYNYTFKSFTKRRWVGEKLLDCLTTEFQHTPGEYYIKAMQQGFIKVNDKSVDENYVLNHNDLVSNVVHKHEPDVLHVDAQQMVIFEDNDMLVIDKPGSIPVHPCGSFNNNSITQIIKHELGIPQVFSIHRLDRLTSGLLIFTKNLKACQKMNRLLYGKKHDSSRRSISKLYIAQVQGRFPATPEEHQTVQQYDFSRDFVRWGAGKMEVNYPLCVFSYRHSLFMCDHSVNSQFENKDKLNFNDSKPSVSTFKLIEYQAESDTSLVYCEAVTGRTHQLRLHLQLLGHPIVNDPIYGHHLQQAGELDHRDYRHEVLRSQLVVDDKSQLSNLQMKDKTAADQEYERYLSRLDHDSLSVNSLCYLCNIPQSTFFTANQLRWKPLHLHAYRYSMHQDSDCIFDYKTSLPSFM